MGTIGELRPLNSRRQSRSQIGESSAIKLFRIGTIRYVGRCFKYSRVSRIPFFYNWFKASVSLWWGRCKIPLSVSTTSSATSTRHCSGKSDSGVEKKDRTFLGPRSYYSQKRHRGIWGLVDPNLPKHTGLPQNQGHRQENTSLNQKEA